MTPKEQVEKFLEHTIEGRERSMKARDYYDGKQWTQGEENVLKARKQAPIVVNRIRPKVEGLVGLWDLRKTDPKAFPVTRKHEKASEPITDALRYVGTNNEMDMIRMEVGEEFFVEGYGGAIVDIKRTPKGIEIVINHIPWDRIYYDFRSRRKDFKDARYKGMYLWLDVEDVPDVFNVSRSIIKKLKNIDETSEEMTEDRPRWADKNEERVRVAMHFHKERGVWKLTIFSGNVVIVNTQDSPFQDEDGLPTCPIELVSANIDRDNQRYGEASTFFSQQDEINHRRSKYHHWNTTRQTYSNENAVTDTLEAKRELRKPDGHIALQGGAKFGEDFGFIQNGDLSNAEFQLYLDAKSELDAVSFNAQLSGERQGELSGKAINKLQQAGAIELNKQYSLLKGWENRIYRQVWWRIKQFWNEEKWIRVTDDHEDLRFVGFNTQITARQAMQEVIEDKSNPPALRKQTAEILQFNETLQNPSLNQLVTVKNPIPELDMDIQIEQSFDVINIQQEQFELLINFAQGREDIELTDLIELSQLRGKDELIAKLEKRVQERLNSPQVQQAQRIQQASEIADIQNKQSDTRLKDAEALTEQIDAVTKQLENQALAANPDKEPQVIT